MRVVSCKRRVGSYVACAGGLQASERRLMTRNLKKSDSLAGQAAGVCGKIIDLEAAKGGRGWQK